MSNDTFSLSNVTPLSENVLINASHKYPMTIDTATPEKKPYCPVQTVEILDLNPPLTVVFADNCS